MIDIHAHILPGVDDGAANLEEALHLAHAAAEEGITDIIATPHHANGVYLNTSSKILTAADDFNRQLKRAGIPLTVHAGQEIRVHDGLMDAWDRGELLSLAGSSYILIEMPGSRVPVSIHELIHELNVLGLTPVIAHPERNLEIMRNPQLLQEMIELGAVSQCTTHSLIGSFGQPIQRCAWNLCSKGWVHVISSDAHHAVNRGFRLQEAYQLISSEWGESRMFEYLDNAEKVLQNARIEGFSGGSESGSFLSRFLRKLKGR